MKILFRTKDPLENTVVLDQVCLEKHIYGKKTNIQI